MLFAHYEHRLPADYDVAGLRERAAVGGPLWNGRPDLWFKAFLLREPGRFGAQAKAYASIYLWRDAAAFTRFVTTPAFDVVTAQFGRPAISTALGLDVWRGPASAAKVLTIDSIDIDGDKAIAGVIAEARDRCATLAGDAGVVAVALALDPQAWRLKRVVLRDSDDGRSDRRYEALYLSQTLMTDVAEGARV